MIVVDAAAVIDALTIVDGTEDLRSALAADELHAPSLIDFEIVSALRGLTLAGHISEARARDALTDLDDLPIQRWPSADSLRRRTLQLRHNLTAHDAAYVALADALGCSVITRDARLARASGHDVRITVL